MTTVLYPETLYADDIVEREVSARTCRYWCAASARCAELDAADCEAVTGLMVMRHRVTAEDFARFPRLRAVVRMGVGYDRIDRAAAAARGVLVCNVPDYGTTEVADHAMALVLALRRGILLYHDTQRGDGARPPGSRSPRRWSAGWTCSASASSAWGASAPRWRCGRRRSASGSRSTTPTGRTAPSARWASTARRTLEALLERADVLSLHAPLTDETRGMLGIEQLRLLPEGAVVVNTARGPILDLAALEVLLREGSIAGAGLDVLPVEPPSEPVPDLLRAYREQEPWLQGRLVITPHAAFHSPEAWADIRRKSAETMLAALAGGGAAERCGAGVKEGRPGLCPGPAKGQWPLGTHYF